MSIQTVALSLLGLGLLGVAILVFRLLGDKGLSEQKHELDVKDLDLSRPENDSVVSARMGGGLGE